MRRVEGGVLGRLSCCLANSSNLTSLSMSAERVLRYFFHHFWMFWAAVWSFPVAASSVIVPSLRLWLSLLLWCGSSCLVVSPRFRSLFFLGPSPVLSLEKFLPKLLQSGAGFGVVAGGVVWLCVLG